MRVGVLRLVVFAISFLSVVRAHPRFQKLIPNGVNVPNWPAVGHVRPDAKGDTSRNPFGLDFLNAKKKWTKNLCMTDSDGDGKTNGEELGDPECVWELGKVPSRITGITNPGIFDKFVGSGENVTTPSPTDASGSDGDNEDGDGDHDHDHGNGLETWQITHAIMMALSFGLIIPISSMFPFYMRERRSEGKWRSDHINLMYFGNSLGFLGFLIAIVAVGVENTPHGILGTIIICSVIVQSLLGYYRQKLPSWLRWRYVHSFLGRSLIVMIALQVFTGYLIVNEAVPVTGVLLGLVHFTLISLMFAAIMRAYWRRQSSGAESGIGEPSSGEFAPLDTAQSTRDYQLS